MSEVPGEVKQSGLWRVLESAPDLAHALVGLRSIAEALGAQIQRVLPSYTDHSVRHMDALWAMTDQIFTPQEIALFSPGEAFVLGASFYVHDLGMAMAATDEGLAELRATPRYGAARSQMVALGEGEQAADLAAVQIAARDLHAENAQRFATERLPGIGSYLIEATEVRQHWGALVGAVSASHHWSLSEVHLKLGTRGKVPDAAKGTTDLAIVACALRLADYAHVNLDRAAYLDRVLRSGIASESLVHWQAQEHVTGPVREEDRLTYGCTSPTADVDAWWLTFESAVGLDDEIAAVAEYLSGRVVSQGRFSLEGVKSVRTPQSFATAVLPDGFDPVDVRFRPDSMERLVEILGGRTLYGQDSFATVRELLQNARDAILLQRTADRVAGNEPQSGRIGIQLEAGPDGGVLSVMDDGVGMNRNVLTKYLLSVAADYWHSSDFHTDFPGVAESGFRPAGRFGIGFLSVFMLGGNVAVHTERRVGQHLALQIRGLGKRGALSTSPASGSHGTVVKISLSGDTSARLGDLDAVARAKAPMLDMPLDLSLPKGSVSVRPGWWRTASQDDLSDFLIGWRRQSYGEPDKGLEVQHWGGMTRLVVGGTRVAPDERWPGRQPEAVGEKYRIMAIPGASAVLLCSKGIAVSMTHIEGMTGLVDIDDVEVNAARSAPITWDQEGFSRAMLSQLRPEVAASLSRLSLEWIPDRYGFLAKVAVLYGRDLVAETDLPWITLAEFPGQARLVSVADFAQMARASREIIVTYGVGPWSVRSVAEELYPQTARTALLVALSSKERGGFGDYGEKEPIAAPLPVHFAVRALRFGRESAPRDFASSGPPLLLTVLSTIAVAWGLDLEAVLAREWYRKGTSHMCGRFAR